MSQQYWVGGFFIDLSRNQITQNKQSKTIAPKALAVLTYLAEHRGKVISHDELLTNVWQGTVVSPNTLQRSIAQLRKALGDDGKIFIKTHAKQGYSLECDVRWHSDDHTGGHEEQTIAPTNIEHTESEDSSSDISSNSPSHSPSYSHSHSPSDKVAPKKRINSVLFAFVLVAILGFIGTRFIALQSQATLSIGELRLLTTTDNRELASIYSPDGRYIVFHRYSEEFCLNNIWAKDMETQEEFQLTNEMDTYGSHSFSKDGDMLAFIVSRDCVEPVSQKKCYILMTLDFHEAILSAQRPKELIECKNSEIRSPIWLNNNNIALLQKDSERWKLISYSQDENTSEVMYSVEGGNIIDYDYSVEDDLIALTSIHSDDQYYIEVLRPDGVLLSSHRINYPDEIAQFRNIYPNFSPFENLLIFSTGRQLFTLSYDGQVSNISLPLDAPMGTPVFHPDGDRMLVIKGHYDSDIASAPIAQFAQTNGTNDTAESAGSILVEDKLIDYQVIERSILGEDSAIKQPGGDVIAYQSERSGEDQVWITDGSGSQQLTNFPMDTYLNGMDWATDGNSILVNVNHELVQVFLDGTQKNIAFEHRIDRLFQWNSQDRTALINARVKGVSSFAELDLSNSQMRIINNSGIRWAHKTDKGNLIYSDYMDRFWQSRPLEDQIIEALDDQGSDKRFVIKNDIIYGVNDDFTLWSYSLADNTFDVLADVPTNVDYLSDIDDSALFMTIRDSARKEVAELSLN